MISDQQAYLMLFLTLAAGPLPSPSRQRGVALRRFGFSDSEIQIIIDEANAFYARYRRYLSEAKSIRASDMSPQATQATLGRIDSVFQEGWKEVDRASSRLPSKLTPDKQALLSAFLSASIRPTMSVVPGK